MAEDVWAERAVVVGASFRDDGYVEQHLIDREGDAFDLILRPRDDTPARALLLVDKGIDYDVFSHGVGAAVLNVTLASGAETITYAAFVGSPDA